MGEADEIKGWDKYRIVKSLGGGAFGVVSLIEEKDPPHGQHVAKRVQVQGLQPTELRAAVNEVHILKMLEHPNVINYTDHFVDKEGFLNIVMEFAAQGDLDSLMEVRKEALKAGRGKEAYFSEDRVVYMSFQMLQALKYIHQIHIIHRDIKPGNMLVTEDGRLKLADFGISKELTDSLHAKSVVGTPYYLAPEICQNKPYEYSSDVWSMGCVMYELAALRRAFEGSNLLAIVRCIIASEYPELPQLYTSSFRELIKKMLQVDPALRSKVDTLITEHFLPTQSRLEVVESGAASPDTSSSLCQPQKLDEDPNSARRPEAQSIEQQYTQWSNRIHRGRKRRKAKKKLAAKKVTTQAAADSEILPIPEEGRPDSVVGEDVVEENLLGDDIHKQNKLKRAPSKERRPVRFKRRLRKQKGYIPEIQFYLLPQQGSCLMLNSTANAVEEKIVVGDSEVIPEECPTPAIEEEPSINGSELFGDTLGAPVLDPDEDDEDDDDYEFVFEQYDGTESDEAPSPHATGGEEGGLPRISTDDLHYLVMASDIDRQTDALASKFQEKCRESFDLADEPSPRRFLAVP